MDKQNDEKIKEERRKYYREYYKNNKEKMKEYSRRYWEKRAGKENE
ncbi:MULTISPECIES: hypothetical protein [Clostridium]|nr:MULTISPECIES: hypothetical protein [Clostridium]CUP08788.1 Uncharacterised protein [Clostridium disporicum]